MKGYFENGTKANMLVFSEKDFNFGFFYITIGSTPVFATRPEK